MQPGTRTKYVDMCGRIVEGAVVRSGQQRVVDILSAASNNMAAASSKSTVLLAPASNNMAVESIKSTRTKHRTFTYFIRHDNGTSGEIRSDCPYLFSADDVIPESILTEHID